MTVPGSDGPVKHDVVDRADQAALDALASGPALGRPGQDGREKRGRGPGARAGENGRGSAKARRSGSAGVAGPVGGQSADVLEPNVTSVDAGFVGWDVATGKIFCEPSTYRLHGLPADGPATVQTFLSPIPAEGQDHVTAA